MIRRIAFKMKLKSGYREEYKKRHDQIWPDLTGLLKSAGIEDYSIFLDEETDTLFAVQKIRGDQDSQQLGQNPLVLKWWKYMADIMETNPDYSPITVPMHEVFYLP